jgi:predicted Zn-dependent protease
MTNHNDNWDEDRLGELLRAAQHPATPPDEQFLARLRARSAAAFLASASEPGVPDSNPKRQRGPADSTLSVGKSKMFIIAWRALAATAAAAVLMVTWFATSSSGGSAATLATVLAKTEKASSLHLRVESSVPPGKKPASAATEAWSGKAGEIRVNRADGTYDVARRDKLWRIDEKANRAASGESPYYRADAKSLDLLPLLGVDESNVRTGLLAATARPVRESAGGKLYDVYRYRIIDGLRPVMVEARVDAATQLLYSLETLVDRDGKVTPAVTLTLLSANGPVDEDLFVVGDSLTEDGRIGKVNDVQGMVAVKPVVAERWTPVCDNILLRPGDWLRTDLRGANAVAARLTSKSQIIAGPGTLVELVGPKKVRLYEGEVQLTAGPTPLELLGPGDEKLTIKTTGVYRVEDSPRPPEEGGAPAQRVGVRAVSRLVLAKADPKWLKGFLGTETQESIGSLVANVDGRNVPLTVGYHKVSVEIRDQIARTTVEESFANLTDHELEGVFYFPLPQDASISGFGMWKGSELVEADIVEKQRAREIYEIIKSERRDPGLLEWQGGNLFSARIFPIPAHAEKRVHIIYTQVLPRTGNAFRYSYALQSEMLRQHPLRELSIDVKINSVAPLKKVASPTHAVRAAQTEHSAHVEFDAREYTPTRDFEVVAELQGKQPELTLIPHRRGDDGYFMLMLAPPAEDTADDRDLLVDKAPLDLILLADTSASMDARQRTQQAEFIAAMLGSLTPRDTVNLACCDVNCDWVFEKAMPAEAKTIKAMREFLDRRASLGWTDLPKAFSHVFQRAGQNTCIVYVGDGIPTVGDADPAAAAAEIRRLYDAKCKDRKPVCHAVSVGSTFESGVLKAIGSLGGGSMRQISGEQGPRVTALDLLKEITRPALRDLKLQFDGLRVARVYPQQLPNLPGGAQQIILGRYLPQGVGGAGVPPAKNQSGKVIVTGRRFDPDGGDREVRFERAVSLADAEQGNSFIPRLWARMHLDYLLAQGATPTIKDYIIALSEEYHIITPYTSLLVLDNDADRERFKVKRDFVMCNGEDFFAKGLDNANFELTQQQMKRAGSWRIGLRLSVLQQLSGLGRDARAFQPQWGADAEYYFVNGPFLGPSGGGGVLRLAGESSYAGFTTVTNGNLSLGVEDDKNKSRFLFDSFALIDRRNIAGPTNSPAEGYDLPDQEGLSTVTQPEKVKLEWKTGEKGDASADELPPAGTEPRSASTRSPFALRQLILGNSNSYIGGTTIGFDFAGGGGFDKSFAENRNGWFAYGQHAQWNNGEVDSWLNNRFGALPPAPSGKTPPAAKQKWPEEVLAISKNLLRSEQLALRDGGLRFDLLSDYFDPRSGDLTSHFDNRFLSSGRSWLVRASSDGGETTVHWCDGKEREVFNRAFQLGRSRKAVPAELASPPINLEGYVLASLEFALAGRKVSVRHPADGQTLLIFRSPDDSKNESRVHVDTRRNVVLSIEQRYEGKTTATQQFSDFTQVAGAWWAGTVKSLDENGRVTNVTSQKIVRFDNDSYSQAMAKQLAGREQVQFLRDPAQALLDAKKALAAGKSTFDDRITLLMHFARSSQWTRAMEQLASAEKLADGKPGIRWLRYAVLKAARRNEELKNLFLEEAGKLSPVPQGEGQGVRGDELYLANHLLGQANGVLETNEMLTLLDVLRPVFARQPEHLHALRGWKQQRAGYLSNAGRGGEATAIYRELAEGSPRDYGVQVTYMQNLQNCQEFEAERKWIEHVLSGDAPWQPQEINQFRDFYTQSLRAQERYEELAAYLARWIEQNPENSDPYTQYLDALYYTDRPQDANALMDKWFREGCRGDVTPAAVARLQGAINWIFNQCQNNSGYYGGYHIDEHWQEQLVQTAVFFCHDKNHVSITEQILNDWRFQQTGAGAKVRADLARVFNEQFDRLTLDELDRFIGWLRGNDSLVTKAQWNDFAKRLQGRYATEPNVELKNRLAQTVANILSFAATPDKCMAFLRRMSREAPEKYRPYYISQLFQTLLNQAWSEKYENEAFDLLGQLGGGQSPPRQLFEQIRALYQLTDRMLLIRNEALAKTIVHAEKLTRTELLKKQAEQLRQTREEFAAKLRTEEAKHRGEMATWIAAERLYLDVLLNHNPDKAAETCWKVLDAQAPKIDESSGDAAVVRVELDALLRNRYLLTLMDLAARKTASPELVRRTITYLDQNIARELAAGSENQQWKLLKFEFLVARDQPKDLEKTLEDWVKAGDADNRWRVARGYLLAEEGKLAEAIARFEAVAAADELGPGEWRTLANWYQAMNRRADFDRAKIEIYKTADEGQLGQWLDGQMRLWVYNQGQLPSQLDPEAVLAFRALLSKSANPQNYIGGQLRELYKACREFRLLSCLADSIPGHTAGQIYPYLQSAKGVIDEIREEAAVDSLVERIAELSRKATTDVDRRAFDLLEAMTERRAAELRNQPGPHVDKAVAALQRAFKRQWSPGEERLMADFLAALGAIPQEKLAAEQLRQLEAFYNMAKPDTQQRLDMACAWARALWSYNRRQPALDLLESEVDRYATRSPLAPGEVQGERAKPLCEQLIFQDYISYLDQAGQYTAAVNRLEQQLRQAEKMQNRRNLEARIIEVHTSALRNRGQVGDLKGAALYRAVQARILGQLPSGDAPFDARLITLLSSLYDAAHGVQIGEVTADARRFAFDKLPPLLAHQVAQYENLVNDLCERVHQICGPADGIAFLLDRYERRPQWLKIRQNFWNSYWGRLNNWRREAQHAKTFDAALSDRLLKPVMECLRNELLVRRTYNFTIISKGYGDEFWSERESDFLRFTEEIYAENKHNGTIVCNVADYLSEGLHRYDRSIEVLQAANDEHLLDESGQWRLVNLLHSQSRIGESIGLLQALVESHPDNPEYRRLLMNSYFRTNRREDLLSLLKQCDDYFHQKDRWGEGALSMLAGSCLQNQLYEQSARYYKEVIELHQRTAANRGIGDGILSAYYGGQAQALAGLKRMPEAVEAACGAIISWGANVKNRADALEAPRNTLRSCESAKLDALVATLDAQAAKTGNDNAFVRKALGQVYSERGQYGKAGVQLRAACALQPNDVEIYQSLAACFDKQNDKQGAIRELLASLQLSRRDIELYKKLGERLSTLHDVHEAERAYTSIVEVLASESESHAMLAEIRESQNRWAEAIEQWRQVAKLRAFEPTGLLRLAAAQLHEKHWAAAAETVKKLRAKSWPQRFGNAEVQIQQLERQIGGGKASR